MTKEVQAENLKNSQEFFNEIKLFVNQKLFEKHLISEEMYFNAKELLLKQGG